MAWSSKVEPAYLPPGPGFIQSIHRRPDSSHVYASIGMSVMTTRQQQQGGGGGGGGGGGDGLLLVPWSSRPREIACRRCRIRKKRCDKKRPTCQECARAGAECQVLRPKKVNSRNEAQSSYVHLLENHIASLESRFRQSYPGIAHDHLQLSPVLRRNSILPTPDQEDNRNLTCHDDNQPDNQAPQEDEWPMDPLCFGQDFTGEAAATPSMSPSMLLDLSTFNHQQQPERLRSPSPVLNLASTALAHRHVSLAAADLYASEYFRNAHPMWPFLHPKQWSECWSAWQSQNSVGLPTDWMVFFVDMVLSIGALLTGNSDPGSPQHLQVFKSLQAKALSQYNSHATSTWPAIFRTQSSLLLTIQAIHSDSIETLRSRASEAMMNCTLSKLHMNAQRRSSHNRGAPRDEVEEEMQRQTIRSCYIIDIIISYSTNQSVSFVDNIVEDELLDTSGDATTTNTTTTSSPDSTSSPSSSTSSSSPSNSNSTMVEDHIFRLRRIQYRILKMVAKLEHEAQRDNHMVPNLWRSQIRHDVDNWLTEVSHHHHHHHHHSPSSSSEERFTSQAWLQKLANYTILSLFPNPALAIRSGDARHLVSAACQVLVTFRRLRVKDHITCYTWTALMHQFQAGITILYCLWATPPHQQPVLYNGGGGNQSSRGICRALFACSATLVDYGSKWPATASVLRDIFELLLHDIPVSEFGDAKQEWTLSSESRRELRRLIGSKGEMLQMQRKVVGLLVEMAGGGGGGDGNGNGNGNRPYNNNNKSKVAAAAGGGGGRRSEEEEKEEELRILVDETRWIQYVYAED